MATARIHDHEERYQRRSAIISFVVFALLILALIYPFLTYPVPPIGQEGILVNLGVVDLGDGDENATPSAEQTAAEPTPPASPVEASEPVPTPPEPEPEPTPEALPPPAAPEPTPDPTPDPEPRPDPELLRQQAEQALALQRESEARAEKQLQQKRQREADARREAAEAAEAAKAAEAARVAAAEEEAARQAAARKAAAEAKAAALKAEMAGMFGGSSESGSGRGDTGKPGNQGDPNGDPSADRLRGISTGAGKIGGGLEARGVVGAPKLSDNSQRTGIIRVKVCVDASGRVTSADYTQKGSTSSDVLLKRLATENAKGYRFSPSSAGTQCGHITYNFVVK